MVMNNRDNLPAVAQAVEADARYARMNITWAGQNGDLRDPVNYDLPPENFLRMAVEAVRNGDVEGIRADAGANLEGFVVDRYDATAELPNRIFVRPKTPFGGPREDDDDASLVLMAAMAALNGSAPALMDKIDLAVEREAESLAKRALAIGKAFLTEVKKDKVFLELR